LSGQQQAPAALYPREKSRTHCTWRLSGPQGRSGRAENLAPTGIRFSLNIAVQYSYENNTGTITQQNNGKNGITKKQKYVELAYEVEKL
jgi:hypothetical protein